MLRALAILLTVATGTSGLVYEVTWERMLAVLLGSHAEATAAVLAFFLGGLAIGIGDAAPRPIAGEFVAPEYWQVLRLRPRLGRLTTPADDERRGTGAVVVLSARLWRSATDADPDVAGTTVRVNGVPVTVIGVLDDGVNGLSERADVWLPSTLAPRLTYAEYLTTPQHFIAVAGRLLVQHVLAEEVEGGVDAALVQAAPGGDGVVRRRPRHEAAGQYGGG